MSHSILNTLKRYIKRGKDVLEVLSHQDVVYKITWLRCDLHSADEKTTKNKITWTCNWYWLHDML